MRRAATCLCVAAGCAGAAAQAPTRSPPTSHERIPALPLPTEPASFREIKLADGVYAFVAPVETPVVSGNSLVVIGDDGVLVVDTHPFAKVARWEIAEIEKLTALPVRYIVNTHWHDDHWLGNAELAARWPHAMILATPSTRAQILAHGRDHEQTDDDRQQIAAARASLARGTHADGRRFTAAERAYLQASIDELGAYVDAIRDARVAEPTATFDDAVTIHLGGREVDVRFLGRGNTGGDAVVFVPDAKVVATGDLLVNPVPFPFGSFIGEWPATLRKVAALGATTIVPGHGEIEHDPRYLEQVIAALESLMAQVRTAVAAGKSLDETRRLVDLRGFEQATCGDDALCHLALPGTFVAPAVERAYREAKDGPLHDED